MGEKYKNQLYEAKRGVPWQQIELENLSSHPEGTIAGEYQAEIFHVSSNLKINIFTKVSFTKILHFDGKFI